MAVLDRKTDFGGVHLLDIPGFIEFLYAPSRSDGYLTVWVRQNKLSAHFPLATGVPDLLTHVATVVAAGHDVYYGVGLRGGDLGGARRGAKRDVVVTPGIWLDVDLRGPGHAADDLPDGVTAGCDLIEDCCPYEPTLIVHTGGGLHAYWLFQEPLIIAPGDVSRINAASKAFQLTVIKAARAHNLHVDQTGNIDRVLRLPHTMNNKIAGNPRPIEVIFSDGPRYDPPLLLQSSRRVSVQVPAAMSSTSATAAAPPPSLDPEALLARMRDLLPRLANPKSRVLMSHVLAGRPFAAPGERDERLQSAASIVAFLAPAGSDPDVLAELFRPSLDAMRAEHDDLDNPSPTVEDAAEKISRALGDAAAKRARDEAMRAALIGGGKISHPSGAEQPVGVHAPPGSEAPEGGNYAEEDLVRFAASQGTTPDGFAKRWIIQNASAYYVFVDGYYRYPVPKEMLLTKLRDDLKPADTIGVKLWTFNKDGSPRPRNVQEMMDHYGTGARQVKGSLTLPRSRYDVGTDTFWEAVCAPRFVPAVYDAKIDEWLRLFGGQEAEHLLDWIATVTHLERQSSALYCSGKAGAGKTMLAHGLARIWTTGGPAELADVANSNFNSDIARCPLVFGDESMSCSTKDLRRLIGSSVHTLRRKYLPNVELQGALRIVLADNGGRMLSRDEEREIGSDDLEAVASKFLHISVDDVPVKYLESLGGRVGTEDWVSGDGIASHALWLAQHRQVDEGGRFLVPGHVTSMTRMLAVQGRIPGLVCEWIVGYLDKPIVNVMQAKTAIVGDGSILINVEAISQYWKDYIQSETQPPTKTRIGATLVNLSKGCRRVGTRRYHDVRPELIYEWSEKNLVGDLEIMRARVLAPVPVSAYPLSAV